MGTKEQTRELILEAAEFLFLEKGLLDVSMEDIALQASCTRRNLYRYFETKEMLSVEVLRKLLVPWNEFQKESFREIRTLGVSGKQELRYFLFGLVGYLETHRAFLRFTAEFDFLFRDRNPIHLDAITEQSLYAEFQVSERILAQILEKGFADTSLRLPVSASILVPTISTVLWGLGQRVALREAMIPKEFGVEGIELIKTQINLIVLALSREEGPKSNQENPYV